MGRPTTTSIEQVAECRNKGMSINATATKLNCSIATVKAHTAKAKAQGLILVDASSKENQEKPAKQQAAKKKRSAKKATQIEQMPFMFDDYKSLNSGSIYLYQHHKDKKYSFSRKSNQNSLRIQA